MLGWLRRAFGGKSPNPNQSVPNGSQVRQTLALGDFTSIEAALKQLRNIGLRLFPHASTDLSETAKDIAVQSEGISFGEEPTIGHWSLIALAGDPRPFENAAHYDDHCYDGFALEDYSSMVSEIIALAGHEWPVDDVELQYVNRQPNPIGPYLPVSVSIKATPEVPPFELSTTKDFDWSIIFRLNERLPREATGRFAIFLDGDATIVFLTPDQILQLNSLCGYEFFYEE
jgi:hypothetical protein